MIPVRGAPVPQCRAVDTPASTAANSGASAASRGFRPTSLPIATTRDRGRLSLIATIRQEVLGVRGDPEGQDGNQKVPGGHSEDQRLFHPPGRAIRGPLLVGLVSPIDSTRSGWRPRGGAGSFPVRARP